MFKKNNQIISILGHCKGKSLPRTKASTKGLSDWKKKKYCNGLCNEPFICLINCWFTWFGLFSIVSYDLKIFVAQMSNLWKCTPHPLQLIIFTCVHIYAHQFWCNWGRKVVSMIKVCPLSPLAQTHNSLHYIWGLTFHMHCL